MKHDLIALSEQFPGIMVQVSLEDLLTAGRTLSAEILDHIDTKADNVYSSNPKEDTFLSREETMDRYRLSDIESIIVKKGGTL